MDESNTNCVVDMELVLKLYKQEDQEYMDFQRPYDKQMLHDRLIQLGIDLQVVEG